MTGRDIIDAFAAKAAKVKVAGTRVVFVRAVVTAVLAAIVLGAPASARTFIVGGKAFSEQYVLAEITKKVLENIGVEAETRVGYATDTIRVAQLSGEVDVSWDYTWTGYSFHLGFSEPKPADEVLEVIREADADNGLTWLSRTSVNNTYAVAMNLDFAAESCIHSMSELAQALRNNLDLRLASDQECHKREDCWLRAQRVYDFDLPSSKIDVMNVTDTYEALRERRAEMAIVYATDGKIPAYDLELLEDPEGVFAEYFLVPVVRNEALREEPRLRDALERIVRALDTATVQELNYRIDVVGQPVEQVAQFFVASKGL